MAGGVFALCAVVFFVVTRQGEFTVQNKVEKAEARSIFSDDGNWLKDLQAIYKEVAKKTAGGVSGEFAAKDPNNLTEQLASAFSKKMVSDPSFDPNNFSGKEDALGQEVLKNVDKNALAQNKNLAALELVLPLDSEIKISKDNSQASIKKYLSQVNSILLEKYELKNPEMYGSGKFINEFHMVDYAIRNSDFSDTNGLADFIDSMVVELKKVSVPSKAVELHKKTIALFSYNARLYRAMGDIKTDPFLALTALQKFRDLDKPMAEILNDTNSIKKLAGISYAK